MRIQINTDDNFKGTVESHQQIEVVMESTLGHMAENVTRVEVHPSDENNQKGGR